jgi:amino acid transporter
VPRTSIPAAGTMLAALAIGKMTTLKVVTAVLSGVALTIVFALVIQSGIGVGMTGIPIVVLVMGLVLWLFIPGFTSMARHIPNTGSFYAYISQGLGRPFGVGCSWVALAAYNAIQVAGYGPFGAILAPLLLQYFGVHVQWFVLATVAAFIIAALGLVDFSVPARVMQVLALTELVVNAVYAISLLFTPGFHFAWGALSLSNLTAPNIGGTFVYAALIFIGFELANTFVEEARTLLTVPRASRISVALIAVGVGFVSLMIISAGGPDVVDRAGRPDQNLFFTEVSEVLGHAAVTGGYLLLIATVLAAGLAFHVAFARYGFALGREGVLFRWLGKTGLNGAPRNGSIVQSVIGVGVIWSAAFAGWDPMTQLFFVGATAAGLGILLLITATSVAIPVYFARAANRHKENLWRRLILPVPASIVLLVISGKAIAGLPGQFGLTTWTGLALEVVTFFGELCAGGIIWALCLKVAKPDIYAGIGRGADSEAAGAIAGAALHLVGQHADTGNDVEDDGTGYDGPAEHVGAHR